VSAITFTYSNFYANFLMLKLRISARTHQRVSHRNLIQADAGLPGFLGTLP
jgi:hypothetical protein